MASAILVVSQDHVWIDLIRGPKEVRDYIGCSTESVLSQMISGGWEAETDENGQPVLQTIDIYGKECLCYRLHK
jgi:hypothetical protein